MENDNGVKTSAARVWGGRIATLIPTFMLLMSAAMKFIQPTGSDEGLAHLGWTADKMYAIGILEIAVAIIYLIPRTAVVGAILVTGYLGGAIATHVRVGDPFIIPAALAVLAWLGVYLREPRLKLLIPFRK